ncbi:MAG TPA: hypothetical protein VIO58_11955 [Candidatus Methanoperedens sp.]
MKDIKKSVPIRPIRIIRVSPSNRPPPRTQIRAGTDLQNTAGVPAAGFQGMSPLLHGARILIFVI